jgi:hypothetical protein
MSRAGDEVHVTVGSLKGERWMFPECLAARRWRAVAGRRDRLRIAVCLDCGRLVPSPTGIAAAG